MKEIIKWSLFTAAAVLICQVHRQEKQKRGSGWGSYGKGLLGLNSGDVYRMEYLDQLRFLASVLVILVHSLGAAVQYPEPVSGSLWYLLTGGAGLGLCCNLLFVLISGALLIPCRQENMWEFYQKRIVKVVVPLVAYYLFYLRYSGLLSLSFSSIMNAVLMVLIGPMDLVPHFWLVYVLIRLYIGVPLLRWMVKDMPDSVLTKIAGVILLGLGVKTGFSLLGIPLAVSAPWFSWEGIFFLGYWLTRLQTPAYDRLIYLGGGISGSFIFAVQCFFPDQSGMVVNDSVFMTLFSMAVFLFFQRRSKRGAKRRPWVQVVSRYSFSILLIHWFMLFVVVEKYFFAAPGMFGGKMILLGVLLQSILALLCSLVFAVVYDNTIVLLAERAVGKLLQLPGQQKSCKYR